MLGHVSFNFASEGELLITILAGEGSLLMFIHVSVKRAGRGTQLFADSALHGWMFLLVVMIQFGLGVVRFVAVTTVVFSVTGA